jgi:hypothetical protein
MSWILWLCVVLFGGVPNTQIRNPDRRTRRRRLPVTAKPRLEEPGVGVIEVLEERCVLSVAATSTWVGGLNSDVNNSGNWLSKDANGQVVQAVPGPTTDVTLPTLTASAYDPVVGANGNVALQWGSLTNQSPMTTLTINAGSSLDVTGQGTKNSTWGSANSPPLLTDNGTFQIENPSGVLFFIWSNGMITGSGNMYLANGGEMEVYNAAQYLGVNLYVGQDGINNPTQTTTSRLDVSSSAQQSAMTSNLSLNNNASIIVAPQGVMNFKATQNQQTTGGVVEGLYSTGRIYDYGYVSVAADTGGLALQIQPQVQITGGTWEEDQNARTRFTFANMNNDPSLLVGAGILQLDNGANILVQDPLKLSGSGTLSIPSGGSATVTGSILDQGNIQLGDSNGVSTLTVTQNVDIEGSGTLTVWAQFNGDGLLTANSQLNVTGTFSVDTTAPANTTISVNTTGTPIAGQQVTFVTATGGTATNSQAPFVFDQANWNGGYAYTRGTLGRNSYYLTT